MIRTLILSAARAVFQLAIVTLCVAGLLFYVTYRLIRWATVKENAPAVREAGFGALIAVAGLGKAIKQSSERRQP